jgi:hypothetical protein
MPVVVNYPPPSSVVVNEVTGAVTVVQSGKPGPQGIQGVPGVVTATSPATYDAPTQTVGVDQTAIAIQPSQVAGTAVVDNDTRLLPAGGAAGQALAKVSATNYDTAWVTPQDTGTIPTVTGTANRWIANFGTIGIRLAPDGDVDAVPLFIGASCTVDRLYAVITTAGSAGSVVRLGLYRFNDDGGGLTLIVDGGTIDGTSATAQEVTVSAALTPGLYLPIAAPQGAPATNPTIRTKGNASFLPGVTTVPSNHITSTVCFNIGGLTAALPATLAYPMGLTGRPGYMMILRVI